MLIGRTGNVEVAATNVVDGLIVDQEAAVRVFNGVVGGQDGIIRLNHGGTDSGSWIDGKLELGLFAIVCRKSLEKESTKARTGAAAERVKDQEALQTGAIVGHATDAVNHVLQQLLSNGIVAASIWESRSATLLLMGLRDGHLQLLAASSLPLMSSSGWKSWR
jgi:hypothetical protein